MAAPRRDTILPQTGHMTLWEHLAELRHRLLVMVIAVAVGALVAWFLWDPLLALLKAPYCQIIDQGADCQLYVTDPLQPFATRLKVSGYVGIMLAMPVLLWQTWRFVTPALYPHEKRYAIPFVTSALLLFAMGAAIAYYTLPQALDFLKGVGGASLSEIYTIDRYLQLITYMMVAFGIGFEFPVLLVALQLVGLITPHQLASSRRIAVVVIVIVAAVITPSGDPISLLALSIPMYIFYEISILIGWLVSRRRRKATATVGE